MFIIGIFYSSKSRTVFYPYQMTRTLFLSGATFYIFLEMGALKHILSLSSYDTYFGTSSGSFLALALTLGWTPDTLLEWMVSVSNTLSNDLSESVFRLFFTGALISRKGQVNFIKRMIKASPVYKEHFSGLKMKELTFSKLAEVAKNNFLCNAVCYDTTRIQIFSVYTTPQVSVHNAVMASMSMIGLFKPTVVEGMKYIDGGLIADYALSLFDPNSYLYYKTIYENVDLPVDINNVWGCLHMSLDIVYGKNATRSGEWSFAKLLQFLPKILDYYQMVNIRDGSKFILTNRTWYVNVNGMLLHIPTVTKARQLYDIGYKQAFSQGDKGIKSLSNQ